MVLTATTFISLAGSTTAKAHTTRITATTPGLKIVQLRSQISHDLIVLSHKPRIVPVKNFGGWIQIVEVFSTQENIDYHKQHYEWATHKLVRLWSLLGNVRAWSCIHRYEGAWNDDYAPYWGGLQMDRGFQITYGSDMILKYHGYANKWHPYDQMIVAQRAYRSGRGYYPWPNTAKYCGLI